MLNGWINGSKNGKIYGLIDQSMNCWIAGWMDGCGDG